jgi:hypothetical protein
MDNLILYMKYNRGLIDKILLSFAFYRRREIEKIRTSAHWPKSKAGRVHMAQIMVKEGYIRTPKEFIEVLENRNV